MKHEFTTFAVHAGRVGAARRAMAVAGAACAIGLVAVIGGSASAGEPEFSASYLCPDEPEIVVTLGGVDGDTFDIYFNDVKTNVAPFTHDSGVGTSVLGDGQYDVIVRNAVTDEVVFVKSLFVGCDAPYVVLQGSCPDGESGEITAIITDNEPDYRYDILIDDVPVIGFLDLEVTDLAQESFTITGVESGIHVVTVSWTEMDSPVDSEVGTLVINCPADGSGTPLPDSGSNTTPLVLAAGLLVAAGLGMLGLRRRTA